MRLAHIRQQNARPTGVGDHANPRSRGHRLRGQQHGHIKELLQGIGADHPGLLEERLDSNVTRGESG